MSGLSLIAYESLQDTGRLYGREFVDDLTAKHERYNHTISAVGGFEQASFILKGNRDYLDAWFDEGLMRRIVLYNPEAVPVWEGYVHGMKYSVGSLQKTISVQGMVNRVYMRFAPLDASTNVAGVPITLAYDDPESQSTWGVKGTVIRGGELTHEEAFAWARTILSVDSEPQLGESINTTQSTMPNIEIAVKGYYTVLDWVPYLLTATGTLPAQQVIGDVLNYFDGVNPGWISTDTGWMDWNFRGERRGAEEYKSCWQTITNIIKKGGAGGERWVGGVYQDRRFIYKAAEDYRSIYGDYLFYSRRLDDPAQRIHSMAGVEVKPWDVLPDRILITVDV